MRYAYGIIGAGAIGGYLAARLARAGQPVAVVARGNHAAAIRRDGFRVVEGAEHWTAPVSVLDEGAQAPCDTLLLGTKANALVDALPAIRALSDAATTFVPLQNGIPWWYTHRHPILHDRQLASVDPGGQLAAAMPAHRTIHAIAFYSGTIGAPGRIDHANNGRELVLAVPDDDTERAEPLRAAFAAAGMTPRIAPLARPAIWLKLIGNVNVNPISALTRATVGAIYADPGVRDLVFAMAREALAVADALGDAPEVDLQTRFTATPQSAAVRTSMLQDLDARRPLELGAVVDAVAELALLASVPTPTIETIAALTALLDRSNRAG